MKSLLAIVLAISLSGCGTIFTGTSQHVRVLSSPDKARIVTAPPTVDYTTPTTINLERKREHTLTISMPGYASQNVQLEKHMRGGILVLDILAGLVGIIVDAATGAWYGLSPDTVNVTLARTAENLTGPDTITVTVTTKDGKATATSTVPGVHVVAQ